MDTPNTDSICMLPDMPEPSLWKNPHAHISVGIVTMCASCMQEFGQNDINKVINLTLCHTCWTLMVITYAESFPDLASVTSALYDSIEG